MSYVRHHHQANKEQRKVARDQIIRRVIDWYTQEDINNIYWGRTAY